MLLTRKQKAFADHYLAHRDGRAAYRHAYDAGNAGNNTCYREAWVLLKNPKVAEYIEKATGVALEQAGIPEMIAAALNRSIRIACADPAALTRVKAGNCRHCHGLDHGRMWRDQEYADAVAAAERDRQPYPELAGGLGWRPFTAPNPECPECGGGGIPYPVAVDTESLDTEGRLLFAGVKPTKHGPEVLMQDQAKHLDFALRIMGAFKDNVAITGAFASVTQVAQLDPNDPHAAVRAYEEMLLTGRSRKA